jgi:hypothetical protein
LQNIFLTSPPPGIIVRENPDWLNAKENNMMDAKKMTTQMIEAYKATFDTSFSTLMTLQEQMERMSNLFWGQMVNLPEEAKKGLNEWTKSCKKNCEDFKKMVDDGFKSLESLAA